MRFAIKDAGNITFYNKATGVPAFYTEDANSFEFKLSAESVYAKAKGNKAIAFDGEITCDLKIEYEVIQFAQLSVLMASDVVARKNHPISKMKKVRVDYGKKVTVENAKAEEGSIVAFKLCPDGQEFSKKLAFTNETSGEDIKLTIKDDEVKENDLVAVFFTEKGKKPVRTITMSNEGHSPNFRIEADVSARDTEGKYMALHLSIKNAKAKRNAELTLSAENPSKFPMELDCFPDEWGDYAELNFLFDDDDETDADIASLVNKLDPEIKLKK